MSIRICVCMTNLILQTLDKFFCDSLKLLQYKLLCIVMFVICNACNNLFLDMWILAAIYYNYLFIFINLKLDKL